MKIALVIIPLGAIVGCSGFRSPIDKQPLRLSPGPGRERFQPRLRDDRLAPAAPRPPRDDVSVGLFRDLLKKFKGGDDDEKKKSSDESSALDPSSAALDNGGQTGDSASVNTDDEPVEKEASPFFATTGEEGLPGETTSIESEVGELAAPVADMTPVESKEEESAALVDLSVEIIVEEEVTSPRSKAEQLRAQAARIRLEADKRQVELTLEKIAKLNSKLESLRKKDKFDAKDQKSLEEELQRLKSQLTTDEKGEIRPVAVPVAVTSESSDTSSSTSSVSKSDRVSDTPLLTPPSLSIEEMEERVKRFQDAPEFMKVLVAKTLGFGVDGDTPGAVNRLNATDIVQKMYDDEIDYESIASDSASDSEKEKARATVERAYENSKDNGKPVFTEEQIQAKVKELEDVPKIFKGILDKEFNDTEMALMLLEQDWEDEQRKKKKGGGFFDLFGGKGDKEEKGEIGRDGERLDLGNRGSFSRLFSDDETGAGKSDLSFMMESLYPQSTRKEDQTPDKRQVDTFLNDVVAPTKAFIPNSDPISVPGGWIIRGQNECGSGDELIEKLDRRIANDARLRDNISFFVLKDPFPNQEETVMLDPLNWPQVLYVAGPDVARDPAVILRTAISGIGIATAWYGSIAPFLANSKLLDRATAAMELADAGMPTDLSWLTEMSVPLFLSFFALQLTHEAAHLAVAKSRNFEITIPTLVPSIMSGITSSITSLKTSPKNKQELIEFAVAGPLSGMIASILVLCYGLVLTATADSATVQMFPGLPLAVLRQSSLGGGLIDIFLGNGVLNVPSSAEGAQALATTLIALHPLAVAGFISLVVNALALVPVGRTDGGRVSMALFGRSGTQAVTFVSLASLFILGLQSDLLLFYFAFIVFCQSELEIPLRNEVDDVDLSRVILASFAGFLMLLTLIPMS
mmetsp:Transcript_17552/g.37963  ORF Transcript_17552/g.37963 Transcript_17552/m.37963 type:complete len:917 (+) Transcript_17552:50-2800(+)|eukprot:CAMPEP_0172553710 /NCGR_PEP_ID=MMETSP1067-20121228/51361_1 /TAXON_ID=265564 ORGANISM="Thalassiosira punctigera, Strain Tpunct2005C2" /NCGR_SAMPLE_ID=MMETSP1067 /ASSEMBLY_ACC=CAM_ASM_000444 /LENGTH=916 /DNA_ID=CAMNT_0013341931 /DNA_START=50 /DNA_END=2803 /DNA_ORIENTATION=-